ncbi:MAG: DUF748 domain-containing protein [Alistipes sp.]|nr:DUF748 domain-containing protein [Alistipes sp.]
MENNVKKTNEEKPAKRSVWLKILKWLGIFVGAILFVVLVIIANLGSIAEHIIEKYDMEVVGRRIEAEDVSIRLFKSEAEIYDITLYEEDGETPFVAFNRLYAKIDLWELLDEVVHIERVVAQFPYARIDQGEESFNFDSLIDYLVAKYSSDEPEDDSPSDWEVIIENIELSDGRLAYTDTTIEQHWSVSELDIATECLTLGDEMNQFDVALLVNDSGRLDADLGLNISTMDFKLDGTVEGFELGDTYKYVVSAVNLSSMAGTVGADVEIEGNILDFLKMNIAGEVKVEELALNAHDGSSLLTANTLSASINRLNLDEQYYNFAAVTAHGYATRFILDKSGTNFDELFYSEPEISVETTTESLGDDMYDVKEQVTLSTSTEDSALSGMTLTIGNLLLDGGSLYFADRTMHKPFEYNLRNLKVESEGFNITGTNKLTVSANLHKQGSATIEWNGSLNDFYNQNLLASLTNVDMKDFTPYLEYFTAFPITAGNLTFRSQNVITNGDLSGINMLDTYKFAVGQKDKTMDAEYNLPLKLGLYVLTDSKEHINIDLPISGRIDSPEFSYRKIIFKALGNVLAKVASAPFKWMSPDKQDAFRHIDVDLLDPSFDSEHYARLDDMAEALKADSTVRVRLTQRINYERAKQGLSQLDLKIAYYNSTQSSPDKRLDMLDFTKIREMRLSRSEVAAFADSQLVSKGIDPTHLSIAAKAEALYGDYIDIQLRSLMEHRNTTIREYMAFQHQDLPDSAFVINDVVIENIRNYKGKDRYTTTLIIDSEEVEIAADDIVEESFDEEYFDAWALEEEAEGTDIVASEPEAVEESVTTEITEDSNNQ